jgi:hypothetical protein
MGCCEWQNTLVARCLGVTVKRWGSVRNIIQFHYWSRLCLQTPLLSICPALLLHPTFVVLIRLEEAACFDPLACVSVSIQLHSRSPTVCNHHLVIVVCLVAGIKSLLQAITVPEEFEVFI